MRLHIRLACVSAALMGVAALVLTPAVALIAQRYEAEVVQRLNAGVAMYVTDELDLIDPTGVNETALEELAHRVMTVNPSAEVYLLDPLGNIQETLVDRERLRRRRVDLHPVRAFLDDASKTPVYGDDPTSTRGRSTVFSVSPIESAQGRLGYLYIVLGGKRSESVAAAVRSSYSLQIGMIAIVGLLLTTLAVAAVLFRFLTVPLRSLHERIRESTRSITREGAPLIDSNESRDEIASLQRHFEAMTRRIAEHVDDIRARDALRRELIAGISHDLRTPLSTLHGYLETIALKEDSLDPTVRREYLQVATRHSQHLQELTSALFELSKLEAGVIAPQVEPFSLAELMHDIALRFRLRAQEGGVRFVLNIDAHATSVRGDIALIERAFENLIGNALRHTPPGGFIRLAMSRHEKTVNVEVTDTGRGFLVSQTTTDSTNQGGLGLAIVRKIVQLHGKQLRIDSTPGLGTTVTFSLEVAGATAGELISAPVDLMSRPEHFGLSPARVRR